MEYSATSTVEGRFFSMIRLTCFILFVCSTVFAKHIVRTTLGDVRGKLVHDETTGTSYYSYTGIPYAEAPVGERRFMPPVSKRPWKDVYDATEVGPVCPQREEYYTRDQMDEDCLVFNVYVPANRTNKLMPVIFHIHEGNFDSQSGNPKPIYGPQLIVRNNILVTLNYRLGALGFLSMCNEQISGNAGLKDVVLAMKTVHKNIKRFGGDPNKITLNGVEASGAIIGYLMLIPETKSLFNNAIIHSGSLLSAKYEQLSPRRNTLSLARELNIKHRSIAELVEKLKCADVWDIVDATEAMIMKDPQRGYRIYNPFTPTVETANKYSIITKSIFKMILEGGLHDKPLLCGFNDQEGLDVFIKLLKYQPNLISKFNENHELIVPVELEYPEGSEVRRAVAERIWDFYFGSSNISVATTQNFLSLISDTQSNKPFDLFVRLFIETKKSPVYYFLYGPDTELNYAKQYGEFLYPGSASSDQIGYAFVTDVTKPYYKSLSPTAKKLQEFTLKVMNNFANYGKPPSLESGPWPKAGPNRYHVALYNTGSEIVHHSPYPGRMDFWQSIYDEFFDYEDSVGSFYCTNDDNHSVK